MHSQLKNIQLHILVIVFGLVQFGCSDKKDSKMPEGSQCTIADDCLENLICVDNICRRTCYSDENCEETTQHCGPEGACIPGTSIICGNNRVQLGETCDDGNINDGDGCSATCTTETGWTCDSTHQTCQPICGDGLSRGQEGCDDGNQEIHDNCPSGSEGTCKPACCGDSIIWNKESGTENCDDGNTNNGDGCNDDCLIESLWDCSGEPSICACIDGYQDNDYNGICLPTCSNLGWTNCDGHGACDDATGVATCNCNDGFQDHDKNGTCLLACSAGAINCHGNGTCNDEEGAAYCVCDSGYTGESCLQCDTGFQDHDINGTCLPSCAHSGWTDCGGEGTCSDTSGVALCSCNAGYQDNDNNGTCLPTCVNIPACVYGTCDDSDGLAECTCDPNIPYIRGSTCAECVVYVDINSTASEPDGTSWANAYKSLQSAINAANMAYNDGATGGCEVWVARGIYHVYTVGAGNSIQLRPHVDVYGGFVGTESLRAERNWATNATILDGSQQNNPDNRVYHVVRGDNFARLDGFHIRLGKARGSNDDAYGGGILIQGKSDIIIDNCVFTNNEAYNGGGMANRDFERVSVLNSIFAQNIGHSGGGALYNERGSLTVLATVFSSNMSTAILNYCTGAAASCGTINFENCLFVAGVGSYGGAMTNVSHAAQFNNCTCVENHAAFVGGCVYVYGDYGSFIMNNSIEWNNPAFALFFDAPATISVSYSDNSGSLLPGPGNLNEDPKFRIAPNIGNQYWSAVTFDSESNHTVLVDSGAAWTAGSLTGLYLRPTVASTSFNLTITQFLIVANDPNSITVNGDLTRWYDNSAFVVAGDEYKIADYHLRDDSNCIDKGLAAGAPTVDLEGKLRVCSDQSAGCPDMGALEKQ